jgi:hypothetical protein
VVLDEPVNGLDPDGVRWIRLLLKSLAAEGRTVFVSSHLMSVLHRDGAGVLPGRVGHLADRPGRAAGSGCLHPGITVTVAFSSACSPVDGGAIAAIRQRTGSDDDCPDIGQELT